MKQLVRCVVFLLAMAALFQLALMASNTVAICWMIVYLPTAVVVLTAKRREA